MFDGVVRILSNVKHISKLRKSLISLGALHNLGYDFYTKNSIMKINKGTLIAMKGKRVKKFYALIKKTILSRAMKVNPSHEESFASVERNCQIRRAQQDDQNFVFVKSTH